MDYRLDDPRAIGALACIMCKEVGRRGGDSAKKMVIMSEANHRVVRGKHGSGEDHLCRMTAQRLEVCERGWALAESVGFDHEALKCGINHPSGI